MSQFMAGRPVPVDRLEIGLRRRRLYEIVRRAVEGARAADTKIRAGGGGSTPRPGSIRPGWRWGRDLGAISSGRPSHWSVLKTVKRLRNGIAPGSWPVLRPAAFVLRREAVGINDGRAALTLPDIAAEAERLAEGQPTLGGEAAFDDGAPEDRRIDS